MRAGLNEYRAAFHVHCHLSHDSDGTIETIAAAANRVGLNAVILTDHYEPGNVARSPRGLVDGVLFVPGVEVRGGGGSMLSFNLADDYDKAEPLEQRTRRFEAAGGVNVFGHVEKITDWNLEPVSGFEIYNLHAQFEVTSRWGLLGRFLFLFPDSFFEGAIDTPHDNLRQWDRLLLEGRRLAPLAGHDAHANIRVFGPLGGTIGTYPEILRLFSTRILAPELTAAALASAVRDGKTYVVFDHLADGSGLVFSYGNPAVPDDARAICGDEIQYQRDAILEVRSPAAGADAAGAGDLVIVVLRDGKPLFRKAGDQLRRPLPGPGVYRAELYLGGRLWIVPAPIYVLPRASAER